MPTTETAICKFLEVLEDIRCKLHGYTVHQQYPTLYFPSNAHNVKKRGVIKTF